MVKLRCHFSPALLGFENAIYADGNVYNLQEGSSELSIELEHEVNEPIEIELHSSLKKEEETVPASFGKRLIGAIVMMLITSWSMDIYDCDCRNYRIKLLLRLQDAQNVDLYVNKVGHGAESELECVTQGGVIAEKTKESVLDRSYAQALFAEYHQLNRWRTGIWTAILLFLIGIGIGTNTITTIIFPAILLCFIVLMFIYIKKRLGRLYAEFVGSGKN